jgi:uncharacterized membrane protein
VIIVDDLWMQVERLMNPAVLATLVLTGFAYGWLFLGTFMPRSLGRLWAVVTLPGAIFIVVIWTIRFMSGAISVIYPVLLLDWFLFAGVGIVAVALRRRRDIR